MSHRVLPTPEERDARRVRGRSADLSALSRYSYLAGLAGTGTLLTMGYVGWKRGVMEHGWGILEGPHNPNLSMAFVLVVVALVMFVVELCIRIRVEWGRVIRVPRDVKKGRLGPFISECILIYITELAMLRLAFAFYRSAGEYGFNRTGGDYYKPWFSVIDFIWNLYLYGGLPYVVITRALQYAPNADRKQAAFTAMKLVRSFFHKIASDRVDPAEPFDRYDRSAILGLGVKFFFVPLMTVFFADQFSHLVRNYAFMFGERPGLNTQDFHNLSNSIIFSVDVGLAWCGYVLSSRWIKNTIFSTEPTTLGWLVALLSYPPFNRTFGYYFSTPGETAYFAIGSPRVVTALAICSAFSFALYTSATVCFGLRFSNLTHRGIITTGPYSFMRHPAYAAKNFSWWCVMFPAALYQTGKQWSTAWDTAREAGQPVMDAVFDAIRQGALTPLLQVVGLVALTGIYYMRALTEEKHLRKDPEYRAYMKKVPYRFIPGVL